MHAFNSFRAECPAQPRNFAPEDAERERERERIYGGKYREREIPFTSEGTCVEFSKPRLPRCDKIGVSLWRARSIAPRTAELSASSSSSSRIISHTIVSRSSTTVRRWKSLGGRKVVRSQFRD